MRIVKKKSSSSDLFGDKVPSVSDESTAAPETAPETAPVVEQELTPVEQPISVEQPDSEAKPVAVASEAAAQSEMNTYHRLSRQSSVTTVTQVTSSSSSVSSSREVEGVEQSESVRKVSNSSRTVQRSLSRHLPEPESVQPEMAHTLDITSSYGTGPMDEYGRPLFGLGALRRKPKLNLDMDSDAISGILLTNSVISSN